MTETTPEAPKAKPKAPAKPAVKDGYKRVTAEKDLRVVTKEFSIFRLEAGVAREVPEDWAFEAQRAAAEAKTSITVE